MIPGRKHCFGHQSNRRIFYLLKYQNEMDIELCGVSDRKKETLSRLDTVPKEKVTTRQDEKKFINFG